MKPGDRVEVLVAESRRHPRFATGTVERVMRSNIDGAEYIDVRLDSGGRCYSCGMGTVLAIVSEGSRDEEVRQAELRG